MRIFKSTNFWGGLAVALTLLAGIAVSIALWDWFREGPTNVESNGATIRNVGLLIGGAVALVFGIWRTIVAQQQLNVAQRGLLNDRYQKGAEMLGSDTLSVRLGGIYALRNLAEEYPEQYHVNVTRLLCAFVQYPFSGRASQDTQVALDVIGSRHQTLIGLEQKEGFVPDLSIAVLSDLDLSGANLLGADLSGANLISADLSGANLINADLSRANLLWANVSDATFTEKNSRFDVRGLTQAQLDQAVAAPDNPPELEGVLDAETGEPLVWRGGPLEEE